MLSEHSISHKLRCSHAVWGLVLDGNLLNLVKLCGVYNRMSIHQLQPLPHRMVVVFCRMVVEDQSFFGFASCGVGSTPVINHAYTLQICLSCSI